MMQILKPNDFPKKSSKGIPMIRIHKSGSITISKHEGQAMNIKPGDEISLTYDQDKNLYYIGKAAKNMAGFPVTTWKGSDNGPLKLSNSGLAIKIAESFKVDLKAKTSIAFELRVDIPITNFGTTYFGLVAKF